MQVFELVKNKQAADFWLEDQAFEGVKRVAGKVAGDVEKVTGVLPVVQTWDCMETAAILQGNQGALAVQMQRFVAHVNGIMIVIDIY